MQTLTSICSKDLNTDRSKGRALSWILLVPTGPLEPHIYRDQQRKKGKVRTFISWNIITRLWTGLKAKQGKFSDLEVSQPAGKVENVSQIGPGISVTARRFGQTKLLGDGKKLQGTEGKHLTGLQQLLTWDEHKHKEVKYFSLNNKHVFRSTVFFVHSFCSEEIWIVPQLNAIIIHYLRFMS